MSDGAFVARLAELARGSRQLGCETVAARADDLQRRALRGTDVTADLAVLLDEHDRFLTFIGEARSLRSACLGRGWIDLADEYTKLIAGWDRSSDSARHAALQRANALTHARIAGVNVQVTPSEHVVERQMLVRRCGYCALLTPADVVACGHCGAKG